MGRLPSPNSSLCHLTPLPHSEHTVSHMFYFPLLPQRMHPSPVSWLQVLLPPSWMSHWAPHFFVSHCLLPLARLSFGLSQICSHVIHLYESSSLFFLFFLLQCLAVLLHAALLGRMKQHRITVWFFLLHTET